MHLQNAFANASPKPPFPSPSMPKMNKNACEGCSFYAVVGRLWPNAVSGDEVQLHEERGLAIGLEFASSAKKKTVVRRNRQRKFLPAGIAKHLGPPSE